VDIFTILALHVLLFGLPTLIIAKFATKFYMQFAYAYFGCIFIFSQILYTGYVMPITFNITLTGGDVAYSSLLLTTLFIVIISKNPVIVRNIIVIQVILSIFMFFLCMLILGTLISPGIANTNAIPSGLFWSLISINFTNTLLYVIEILLMFFSLEKLKRRIRSFTGRLVIFAGIYIAVQTLDGFLYPLIIFSSYQQLSFYMTSETLGNLVLGLLFTPFIIIFILIEKTNFDNFSGYEMAIGRLIFPTKADLQKRLQRAQNEIEVLQSLLPYCPSCKKVRNDDGYWDQLENYMKSVSPVKFTNALCPDCMSQNHRLILSYFNTRIGPVISISAPRQEIEKELEDIPRSMDIYHEAFFAHSIDSFDTANLPFSINNNDARGRKITFMISYVAKKDLLDIPFTRYLLDVFARQFSQIKHLEQLFVADHDCPKDVKEEKKREVASFFEAFFESINEKKTRFYLDQL